MQNIPEQPDRPPTTDDVRAKHLRITEPSPWVARFASLVAAGGTVLDVAAGGGRHARHFLANGYRAVAVDRGVEAMADLANADGAAVIEADLEDGRPPFGADGPLHGMTFDAVVVVNYLHRPLIDDLIGALNPGGVLIYETFARGNEDFARPRNPTHLLKSGELLEAVSGKLQVVAYEHGRVEVTDIPGVKQRLCAVKDLDASVRDDGEPPAHGLK